MYDFIVEIILKKEKKWLHNIQKVSAVAALILAPSVGAARHYFVAILKKISD